MNLRILSLLILLSFTAACQNKSGQSGDVEEKTAHGQENHSYYTCTMHPQVHEHGPGSCPICGMPLVKTTGNSERSGSKKGSSALLPTDYQKKVLQTTEGRVIRKPVSFEIPVGGRHLGSDLVAFYVYEADLMRVKVGQKFVGECASMPGVTLEGRITRIDTVADPASRSVRVVGNITSPHRMNLLEGSFFGKIETTPVSALMIPYDAVLRTGKESIVYKIDEDGGYRAVPVSLGFISGDQIEVTSGLKEGDLISFGPNFLIDSESRLKGTGMTVREGME